jgi:tRNA-dihydrouridine synthase B
MAANPSAVPLFLAPMSGVSDLPFRLLAKECDADVTITEFTSSAGLSRDVTNSWLRLESDAREEPFIPQIFGGDKDEMVKTVELLQDRADIIDLNFGCPAPKVAKVCAGAALMGQPDDLVEMVEACIAASDIPITAKLRLGTGESENNVVEICQRLAEAGVMRLCVHGRTLRQGYAGIADWQTIRKVIESVDVPVIANGDICDAGSAARCLEATGAAGLMVGRGAIGRPMVFSEIKAGLGWNTESPPWQRENIDLWGDSLPLEQKFIARSWCWNRYVELAGETTGLQPKWLMRHAVAFTKGLPKARDARNTMMRDRRPEAFAESVAKFLTDGSSQ